jgi:hypothetical protein
MAKERDVLPLALAFAFAFALRILNNLDDEHIVVIVIDGSRPANHNHVVVCRVVDRRLAHVGAVVADEQLIFIGGVEADPVRIANPAAGN